MLKVAYGLWMMKMKPLTCLFLVTAFGSVHLQDSSGFKPCSEIHRELRFPCRCALGATETVLDGNPSIFVDCDRIVFSGDFPALPYGAPIVSFRQRWAGHQVLPTQLFASSGLPLRTMDFSGNSLRRLTDRLLQGLQGTLTELLLADNLLGDTLNPIFSSTEFHGLKHLRTLDLSGNGIKAIEEGILEGCENLQRLALDRNKLVAVPSASLNGPKALKGLSLKKNRIGYVKSWAFQAQKTLEHVDLSSNLISAIEGSAFDGLLQLKTLKLARNRLTRFNSDVFQGCENLQLLDLSENFIGEFPKVALKAFDGLRYLNLSSNLIQNLDNNDLASLVNLYYLDLSRNNIANIVPGTFLGLKQLRKLDISVNSLRTIEDDAFEGLDNLEELSLKDNNILLIPASALGRLPHLRSLHLDYNRVAALSGDILRSVADHVSHLVISRNIVRELPAGTFKDFHNLQRLDLTRNLLNSVNTDTFEGLDESLVELRLSQNKIGNIGGPPLGLRRLRILDLSENMFGEFSKNSFSLLSELEVLNLSSNTHLSQVSQELFQSLGSLKVVDLSLCGLKILGVDFWSKSRKLQKIFLNGNRLSEIQEGTFVNLLNLTEIDLSNNNIGSIRPGSFVNVMNIRKLNLKGNQLNSFKGEFFNTGTSLEFLDISDNKLSYLFPSSFRIHPRLKEIRASGNKLSFFPADVIATLQFLEFIDLSKNSLKAVEELDFARLPKLRTLLLNGNEIDQVSEMAFHNTTQLQVLDLSYNKLERLGERIFEGLVRLELLNLEGNLLTDLPETIFDRSKLQMLENINLAKNMFETAPLKPLQRQYFFVSSVDLSENKITEIPADDSIMVNIKRLDLSFNPLSETAIRNVLGEPKTVRELNLAATGMKEVTRLETPFLNHLNVSFNNIYNLSEISFERTTLLETLDLSHNQLSDLDGFQKLWQLLRNIQNLNLSVNPIKSILQQDFSGLDSLNRLSIHSLEECSRIEKGAFKAVPNLSFLEAYDYPKLGYLDVQGVLQGLPYLEEVNVETKDAAVGADQLQTVLHPRLKELGLRGNRLRSISSGTLSGLKGSEVKIRLMNTSLTALPATLFFPVPRSSKIELDVSGNQLTTLTTQMLVTLEDRRGDLRIVGLETNPIVCDCSARALRRWLPSHMTQVRCTSPQHLSGKLLVEIGDDELTCDPHKLKSSTQQQTSTQPTHRPTRLISRTTEPEIIWSLPSTEKTKPNIISKPSTSNTTPTNDDTLIIGIVGGVVAFIAILIIVICIIRLKMTGGQYAAGQMPVGSGHVIGAGSSCACSVKGAPQPVYGVAPSPYGGYSATLPHKMNLTASRSGGVYSTMGRVPYYQTGQPYFVPYPGEEKVFR